MVQSSLMTTFLLVPVAGVGLITLRQAFPDAIGASPGTPCTAMLATLAASGPKSQAGAETPLPQFGLKLPGTLLVYPWGPVRHCVLAVLQRFTVSATVKRPLAVA